MTEHHWELASDLASIRTARALVTEHLEDDDLRATAALLVSEAVTDAVVYGGAVSLRLRHHDDRIRVEVAGTGLGDAVAEPDAARVARGLIFDAYSSAWGVERTPPDRRLVWFELATSGVAPEAGGAPRPDQRDEPGPPGGA